MELINKLQDVRLRGDLDLKIYKDSSFEFKNMPNKRFIKKLCFGQKYVLSDVLDRMKQIKAQIEFPDDFGYMTYYDKDKEYTMLPIIVEQEHNGKRLFVADGTHRHCHNMVENKNFYPYLIIRGVGAPYYAQLETSVQCIPFFYNSFVKRISVMKNGDKKYYYREYNKVFPNSTGSRGDNVITR
jgi:hypothetical protein